LRLHAAGRAGDARAGSGRSRCRVARAAVTRGSGRARRAYQPFGPNNALDPPFGAFAVPGLWPITCGDAKEALRGSPDFAPLGTPHTCRLRGSLPSETPELSLIRREVQAHDQV